MSHQGQSEKLLKAVMQEYLYRNAIDPTAYWPEKYWLTKPEGTASSHLSPSVTQGTSLRATGSCQCQVKLCPPSFYVLHFPSGGKVALTCHLCLWLCCNHLFNIPMLRSLGLTPLVVPQHLLVVSDA